VGYKAAVKLTAEALLVDDIAVSRETISHPLLGRAHVIELDGKPLTAMSELDFARPTHIPTIAEPARLPPGRGAALLNAIAILARDAGVRSLRYAGPYPTPALYRAVLRSFRASADEATFTRDVLERAIKLSFDEIAVDFAPTPHERVDISHGFVELRDGVERVVIDNVSYEHDGSPARLVREGDRVAAELWFGDATYARIAEIDATGALVSGPHAIPPLESRVLGAEFPDALRLALAELVAQAVPAPLADDARSLIAVTPIVWADLGARAARASADQLELHAAIWERISPLGLGRLALSIAEALAPVVTTALLAAVTKQ
jgi:hypothetical protein